MAAIVDFAKPRLIVVHLQALAVLRVGIVEHQTRALEANAPKNANDVVDKAAVIYRSTKLDVAEVARTVVGFGATGGVHALASSAPRLKAPRSHSRIRQTTQHRFSISISLDDMNTGLQNFSVGELFRLSHRSSFLQGKRRHVRCKHNSNRNIYTHTTTNTYDFLRGENTKLDLLDGSKGSLRMSEIQVRVHLSTLFDFQRKGRQFTLETAPHYFPTGQRNQTKIYKD